MDGAESDTLLVFTNKPSSDAALEIGKALV